MRWVHPVNKILLLIKAQTFHQAKAAARERKIYISDLCAINPSEFRARAEESQLLAVQRWFNESTAADCPKGGFPVGTLLFFKPENPLTP